MLVDDFFVGTKLYQKKFTELCKPIIDYLGATSVQYVNMDKSGGLFTVYSLPKWAERVAEKRHYQVETSMVKASNIHNGFAFCSASEDEIYKDTLLYDGALYADWWHAFNYVEKTPSNGGYFAIGFATTKDNYQMHNRLINESHIIKKMIKNLNKEFISSVPDLEARRIDCVALKGDAFHTQKGVVFHQEQENQDRLTLLKEVGLVTGEDVLTKPALSPQEINCLRVYMTSQSIKEVARTLDLEITTVTSYIENIKNKLNCHTKHDLLQKGLLLEALGHI